MVNWDISEGAYILITFTQPLTGVYENNQSRFTVSWVEYNYVPGGSVSVSRSYHPASTFKGENDEDLILEMAPLQRFNNAVGNITVAYDGMGTLAGEGGSVEAFSVSFTPVDLLMKPNQNDREHIQIASATVSRLLTRIYYNKAQGQEHLNIASASWTGTLTHIDDL